MNRERRKYIHLLKNMFVFGAGTFGSKVLQFLIVPLYTYVLTTEEYGKIDIFVTTISLVLPFITLLIQESIIRYLTVNEIKDEEAVNSGIIVFCCSVVFSLIFAQIYALIFGKEYAFIFFICLVLVSFVSIFQNYLKACGQVMDFAICGLINTASFLITNIFMLLVLKSGMLGYLYSVVISQIMSAVYILIRGRVISKISISRSVFKQLRDMLKYSIPLIPNSLMWWIMNAGDKYIINFFLGDGANGLYSISIKLATIVTTFFGIFMQAWQLSAIEENGKEEQTEFYSKVYSNMIFLLLSVSAMILLVNRPLFRIAINKQFFDAHLYSPLLCVATVINCVATFLGTIYLVSKSTSRAFITTVIGAITNVFANLVLIKWLGLTGVALGTIIGYIAMTIMRMTDSKKYIAFNLDIKRTIAGTLILLISSIVYMFVSDICALAIGFVSLLIIVLLYLNNISDFFNMIKNRVRRQ